MSISKISVNGTEYQLCHNASSSAAGIAKLYSTFGDNEDGSITQKALNLQLTTLTGQIAAKQDTLTAGNGIKASSLLNNIVEVDFSDVVTKDMYWDHYDDFYGIQWTSSNTNPTRIGNEAMHRKLPIQSKMRRCLVADDGTVTPCTSQTQVFPNNNTQWMVEIPEYWYMATSETNNNVTTNSLKLFDHEVPGAKHSKKVYVGVTEAMSNDAYIKDKANILTYTNNPEGTGYVLADGNGYPLKMDNNMLTYNPTTGEVNTFEIPSPSTNQVTYTTVTVGGGTGGHDYVEIGGIKWATMNVGANSITDTGLYFPWGDTQGYTAEQVGSGSGQKYFGWADYKYGNGTSSPGATGMTKYNDTDGLTTLEAIDDAAVANWGDNWRMPTTAEFQALGSAVNKTWTQVNNVYGILCTDKTDSSKTLFFPAAGYYGNGIVEGVGNFGGYWSSSLYTENRQSAYYLSFSSYGPRWNNSSSRYYGCSVRGVFDGSTDLTIQLGSNVYTVGEAITVAPSSDTTNTNAYSVSEFDPAMLTAKLYSGSVYYNTTLSNQSYTITDFIVDSEDNDGVLLIQNHAEWFRGGDQRYCESRQYDTLNKSQIGRPITYLTRANFRTRASSRGTGWSQQYWDAYMAWVRLYVVEYASFNSQDTYNANRNVNGFMQGGLGAGVSDVNSDKWILFNSYNPLIPCGVTRSLSDSTGVVSVSYPADTLDTAATTLSVPSYRGIENPFGHIWKWMDGVNVYANSTTKLSTVYICDDPDKFADNTTTNYTRTIANAPYNKKGYIKTWWWDENGDFIPLTIGGSASTYLYDYSLWGTSKGWKVLLSGGCANIDDYCGLFYFNASLKSSYVNAYLGSRLCYTPSES